MAYGVILGQTPQSSFPVGGIILWSGSQDSIPAKWQLCDGTNGTPDLRNKFIIGAGNQYEVGSTGGEETHILTINEMPSHNHEIQLKRTTQSGGNNFYYGTGTTTNINIESTYTGNSQPHNNMPPYYALCYIMKIV